MFMCTDDVACSQTSVCVNSGSLTPDGFYSQSMVQVHKRIFTDDRFISQMKRYVHNQYFYFTDEGLCFTLFHNLCSQITVYAHKGWHYITDKSLCSHKKASAQIYPFCCCFYFSSSSSLLLLLLLRGLKLYCHCSPSLGIGSHTHRRWQKQARVYGFCQR